MSEKYDERDDQCDNLAKWTKSYGTKPQLEWVHLFFYTLDVIPMNWYLEIELYHGSREWDILMEGFLLTFSFEDGFTRIDEGLQEIKAMIFKMLQEPSEWIQAYW